MYWTGTDTGIKGRGFCALLKELVLVVAGVSLTLSIYVYLRIKVLEDNTLDDLERKLQVVTKKKNRLSVL